MSVPSLAQLENTIGARAAAADRDDGDLSQDIADLREEGWLAACLPNGAGGRGWGTQPAGTIAAFDALRALGRANLSVARLFEGHVNAVKLIALYGNNHLSDRIFAAVRDGALLGVWGADDAADPVRLDPYGRHLRGAKRFASGLGQVTFAVISASSADGPQLLVVPTGDAARADASGWRMGGMRATKSGRYDFGGVPLEPHQYLGRPGDFLREPFFEGGIWRYCAAHLGGAEALYRTMRSELIARARADDPHQQRRLVDAAIAIETARMWILRAGDAVEADGADAPSAALSLLAREVTERSCRTVLATVEKALGMGAHVAGSPVERIRRDLALFLCQAAPDAKRARAATTLTGLEHELEHL